MKIAKSSKPLNEKSSIIQYKKSTTDYFGFLILDYA